MRGPPEAASPPANLTWAFLAQYNQLCSGHTQPVGLTRGCKGTVPTRLNLGKTQLHHSCEHFTQDRKCLATACSPCPHGSAALAGQAEPP